MLVRKMIFLKGPLEVNFNMKQSFIKNLENLYTYKVVSSFLHVWLFQNYQNLMLFFFSKFFWRRKKQSTNIISTTFRHDGVIFISWNQLFESLDKTSATFSSFAEVSKRTL